MDSKDVGWEYWLRWQVFVCAIIVLIPALIATILFPKARSHNLRNFDTWMPCWRNLHPLWLLVYRAFAFFFMGFLLYLVAESGIYVFYFYTQWTFLLVVIYFAFGTIISASGCWMHCKNTMTKIVEKEELLRSEELKNGGNLQTKGDCGAIVLESDNNHLGIQQRAGFWGSLLHLIYQTCAGAAILTDVVFWCVLVPMEVNVNFQLSLLIGCMHSLNALFLIGDTAMNNLPFSWFGIVYFVLWSCIYDVFQWVLHACGVSGWAYPFLDLSSPWAPLWYIGMAAIHIPCYGIYVLLVKTKLWICSTFSPNAFIVH